MKQFLSFHLSIDLSLYLSVIYLPIHPSIGDQIGGIITRGSGGRARRKPTATGAAIFPNLGAGTGSRAQERDAHSYRLQALQCGRPGRAPLSREISMDNEPLTTVVPHVA